MQSKTFTYEAPGPLALRDAAWPKTIYGLRVVPILGPGQTAGEAYANLGCSYTRRNTFGGLRPHVDESTQTFDIDGPSFFGTIDPGNVSVSGAFDPELTGGINGMLYKVWIACSQQEAIIASASFANGLAPVPGPVTQVTESGVAIPNGAAPTLANQGIAVGPSGQVNVEVASHDGASTVDAAGSLGCWIVPTDSANPAGWVRAPDFDIAIVQGGLIKQSFGNRSLGQIAARALWRPIGMAETGGGVSVDLTYLTA